MVASSRLGLASASSTPDNRGSRPDRWVDQTKQSARTTGQQPSLTMAVALSEAMPLHRFLPALCHTRSRGQGRGRRPQRGHGASVSERSPAAALDVGGMVWHLPPTRPGCSRRAHLAPQLLAGALGSAITSRLPPVRRARASVAALPRPSPDHYFGRFNRWSYPHRPPHSERRNHPHRAWRATPGLTREDAPEPEVSVNLR